VLTICSRRPPAYRRCVVGVSVVDVVVSADSLRSVGKALAQARQAKLKPDGKSMTQKDLATAVNAKPQDVSAT
jgi:hypothetical protein